MDSFHTGYVLEALDIFIRSTGATKYEPALRRATGISSRHSSCLTARRAITTRRRCRSISNALLRPSRRSSICANSIPTAFATAIKVAEWTIENMQDETGYFYYRKYPLITNKTPTLHWGQATMFAALALLDQHLSKRTERPRNVARAVAMSTRNQAEARVRVSNHCMPRMNSSLPNLRPDHSGAK